MSINVMTDVKDDALDNKPGAQLSRIREQKGYTAAYVAGKLHLRTHVIELIDQDAYESLSASVFVKGYLRAYAKFLEVDPTPYIDAFNRGDVGERKIERALWQSRRRINKAEHTIRWGTAFFALIVVVALTMWWSKSKEAVQLFPATVSRVDSHVDGAANTTDTTETEIRLTDLSKMRSLLSSVNQTVTLDTPRE